MVQTRTQEAKRIIAQYEGSFPKILEMLDRQFSVLHNRAQVLLTLCGIIISTTGFSGRNIAGTSARAQNLIISGVAMVLLSAAVVCWEVLHLRWTTMQPGDDTQSWLTNALEYRDRKTLAYRVGLIILLFGLASYCAAIALMLLNPLAPNYPPR